MISLLQPKQSRREFMRASARYALLGAALVLARALAWRQPTATTRCFKTGVCRSCAAFRGCAEPQAVAARKETL